MKKENIARVLRKSVLFQKLGPTQLLTAASISRVLVFKDGTYIYRRDDPGEAFYVVAEGEAELVLPRKVGDERIVGRIGYGGHFGETSLITGKPHSLAARALGNLVLISFDKRVFHEALLGDAAIQDQMNLALAERLRISYAESAELADENGGRHFPKGDFSAYFEQAVAEVDTNTKNVMRISSAARQIQSISNLFANNLDPVLLTGESGTGRRFLAKQIHLQGIYSNGPYIEIDLRDMEEEIIAETLFGNQEDAFPFTKAHQVGTFEQFRGGTVVLLHCEFLSVSLQQKILGAINDGIFTRIGGKRNFLFQSRIILISEKNLETLTEKGYFVPQLQEILLRQQFRVPPLREHRRDLPRLIDHYLRRYSRDYGKNIHKVPPDSMGILLNYDWPGNLSELASVIQRAVMLARENEILTDQILLGLPKAEGKWEFNLLRIPWIRSLLQSKIFPTLPRVIVGSIFLVAVLALFFGPKDPEKNIGITISWMIGWPVLFFSFFFLARIWCSVCTLAVPGRIIQNVLKPERRTPEVIKKYSGWIMAIFCIIVLWVEIIWDAYGNPFLSGSVIIAVTLGSFIFSALYKRRVWCRYVCPLGAINAIFAMPSILELRANRHFCLNRCRQHVCFAPENEQEGCPMFRHPFLVDNNRDCILCARCIKNCRDNAIHLNLRLAPQELWNLETPRRPDSFLIVALGAIFFPFALQSRFLPLVDHVWEAILPLGIRLPPALAASLVFFGLIVLFELGYGLMVAIQARFTEVSKDVLVSLLSYGFIPMILGCYMAAHFELFVGGAWSIWPNVLELMGSDVVYQAHRLLRPDTTVVFQNMTVLGGMLASFYAVFRIMARLKGSRKFSSGMLLLPYSFMIALGGLALYIM